MDVKVTSETNDTLNRYDAEALLKTIPNDYTINQAYLKMYANKAKLLPEPITITLSQPTQDYLTSLASNYNVPVALIFNFLIETVCDCGKVHTKDIKHALKNYYHVVTQSLTDPQCKTLFAEILASYADSPFYKPETGLSEESMAYFLTTSQER